MITFQFQIKDKHVNIPGLDAGNITQLEGDGQKWRLWHSPGHGYQSGREWKYGNSSTWIVCTENNSFAINNKYSFELGRQWKNGRKILRNIVQELNQNEQHAEMVKQLAMQNDDKITTCQELQTLLEKVREQE